jgi:hypothetical protein
VRYSLAIGDSVRKVDRKAVSEKGSFAYSPLIYEIARKERRTGDGSGRGLGMVPDADRGWFNAMWAATTAAPKTKVCPGT